MERPSAKLDPQRDRHGVSTANAISANFCHNKASAVTVLTGAAVVVAIASIRSMMSCPSLCRPA